jgi:hypothetical protein
MTKPIKALLFLCSSKWGAQSSSTLRRHDAPIKCSGCDVQYFLEYNPPDLSEVAEGLTKLIHLAQITVNESHAEGHPTPITLRQL